MEINLDSGQRCIYTSNPDKCPVCHHGIEPRRIGSNFIEDGPSSQLQLIFRCPRHDCQHAFIATYCRRLSHIGARDTSFSLDNVAPYRGEYPPIPDEIKEISTGFVDIYSQAHMAEHFGLHQIAGAGYRKSLEFLVKDFCVSNNPEMEQQIKGMFLAACIDDFVDDTNIKGCAKRATWLGNDETHYVRKWEDKEVRDLKILIELTMAWIRNHVLTAKYLTDMK